MRRSLLLAVLAALLCSSAHGQTPLIIDRARQDRVQQTPPPVPPGLPQPKPNDRLAKVAPFNLTSVRIQGTSLPPAVLGAATQSFVGKTVDAAGVRAIAQAVSDAYGRHGDVALYTVTVPEQDFAGGVMTLIVTEGYIAHVEVSGDVEGDVRRVTAMALKLTREKPLKRSTLQRYLSLMRDLPGLTIDPQLLAGEAPGEVRMALGVKQLPYALALNINNGGNALLGRTQMQADLSLYNLLRQGGETKLTFGTSTLFDRYQYYGLSHGEALDDEGTRATLAFGYLRTDIGALGLSGDAKTLQLVLSHPLIRSFEENLSIAASMDGINSTNALLGNLLANEDVRTVRLSSGYSLSDEVSLLSLNASASFGINGLGARTSTGAETSFQKLVLQGQYNRLLDEKWVARLRAVTQLASTRLPVSELYALGGPDFGRAYLQATALGDSAVAGSAEIGFLPKGLPGLLAGMEVFVFGDQGATWYRARSLSGPVHFELSSAGAGARLPIGDKTKAELQAAHAVESSVPGVPAGSWRFLFGLSFTQ